MANLSTTYLGLELKNPFIVGSSGLTATYEGIARLAKNGAAAVVLKSIFEEEIQMEFREALKNQLGPQDNNLDFLDYLDYQIKADVLSKTTELIRRVKADFDLKVIASIHCRSVGEWFAYAAKLQEAGADALELNIYRLPSSLEVSAAEIAEGNERIIEKVMKHVRIPVSVKMSAYTTDVAYTAQRYAQLGVKGLVLFNRFYQPDIDLENNRVVGGQVYSNPNDYTWPLRWVSILAPKVALDLAASNGVHTADTAVKMLVAGAAAIQVVSSVYKNGPDYLLDLQHGLDRWMDKKGLQDMAALRAYGRAMMPENPELFERVQFMKYFGEV
jgi:dihydroorotate dehydrogenase (fumarate)